MHLAVNFQKSPTSYIYGAGLIMAVIQNAPLNFQKYFFNTILNRYFIFQNFPAIRYIVSTAPQHCSSIIQALYCGITTEMQTKTILHFSCPCSVSSDIVTRMWHKIILYIANVILEYKPQVHMHM